MIQAAIFAIHVLVVVAPNDADFPVQWPLQNTGQTVESSIGVVGADIKAMAAWERHTGTRPVVVAIIGTGVSLHPEFADRILPGYVSSLAAGDPFSTLDTGRYGTHAAGIIAASRNNGTGIAGLNDKALILPIRVAQGAQVSPDSIADGLIWAADQHADIALVLVQLYNTSQALAESVAEAAERGVLIVAPAGHDGINTVAYPAAYAECSAVSATDSSDELSQYSNFGPQVDLAAPGETVWSTSPAGQYTFENSEVSFAAAAHVAGVASLLRSFNPGLSAQTIRNLLLTNSDDRGPVGPDVFFGAGRLNAQRALMSASAPLLRFEPVAAIPTQIPPMRSITFPLRIVNGSGTLNPTSPELVYRTAPGAFTGAIRMQLMGGNLYSAALPALGCGTNLEFYLLAGALSGLTVADPPNAPFYLHNVRVNADVILFEDKFEEDLGWTTSMEGVGTTGAWTRDDPVGTALINLPVQSEYDRTDDEGSKCYFTGQHEPDNGIGASDVDFGPVALVSPVIDIAQHRHVEIRFATWLHSSFGEPDELLVEFSRNGGAAWTAAQTITPTSGWASQRIELDDFPVVIGSQLRVRFTISDNPSDSLTEAAIDDFQIVSVACDGVVGDANGDGIVNLRDMANMANCLTGPLLPRLNNCGNTDLNGDLRVDMRDLSFFARHFAP